MNTPTPRGTHPETTSREAPQSLEAEQGLISCAFIAEGGVMRLAQEAGVKPCSFFKPAHAIIWGAMCALHEAGSATELHQVGQFLQRSGEIAVVGGFLALSNISDFVPTTASASWFIERVVELAARREVLRAVKSIGEDCHDSTNDITTFLGDARSRIERATAMGPSGSILTRLESRRAGCGRAVRKQVPVFHLGDTPVFTRGNIGLLTGHKKEGKSAATSGMLGALIGGPDCSGDTLHFSASNEQSHAVLHLDTEQSPEDHERVFANALSRAGRAECPAWLYSYGVKGVSLAEVNRTLDLVLAATNRIHGGVCAVILDGVADFVSDPNKPEECNPFVTRLEGIATGFNCAVVCVLHLNPSPTGQPSKSRGHLGSQLERKCETDLRIAKDGEGVTTMFTACARRKPILEKDGPRFSWDAAIDMHGSLQLTKANSQEAAKADDIRDLTQDAFGEARSMRYGDLILAIISARNCSKRTAERSFGEMKKHDTIKRALPNLWAKAI